MRLSRRRRRRRGFSDQGRDGATRKQFLRPCWTRREFSNQSGDSPDYGAYGATFQNKAETARPRINSSRPRWRRITFQTKANAAKQLLKLRSFFLLPNASIYNCFLYGFNLFRIVCMSVRILGKKTNNAEFS